MTPRRRAILIVGLGLLLVAAAIGLIFVLLRAVGPGEADPTAEPEPIEDTTPEAPVEDFENPLILTAPVTDERTESRQIAELFAERYGSYSNQGDYQNLRDLLPVMTARYRAETEAFLEDAEPAVGQTYEGVTSKKVSTTVRELDADSAVIAVSLQQEKASGASAPTVGYRTLRMELRKAGDDWLVDRAAWED